MEWQPIETAPKDGTWILLTGGDIDHHWDDEDNKPSTVSGYWVIDDSWQFALYEGGWYGEYNSPTHWMPLPPPPSKPIG